MCFVVLIILYLNSKSALIYDDTFTVRHDIAKLLESILNCRCTDFVVILFVRNYISVSNEQACIAVIIPDRFFSGSSVCIYNVKKRFSLFKSFN